MDEHSCPLEFSSCKSAARRRPSAPPLPCTCVPCTCTCVVCTCTSTSNT
ncbi:hypothetical protein EYF80_064855 [Liparis tanakae]|uniref:Uncharacterized protein n=1 Tax=Liparis tanakae TaxID=230148 RepID=A0A4Z2E885_9TELE|nr:hypothetical protein EYF80_064855 [Liparis tanakae]